MTRRSDCSAGVTRVAQMGKMREGVDGHPLYSLVQSHSARVPRSRGKYSACSEIVLWSAPRTTRSVAAPAGKRR